MKPDIHPNYVDTVITCTCGATYQTRSTQKDVKFARRFGATQARRVGKPKLASAATAASAGA